LSHLQHTIERCHQDIANYRFDLLANNLYEFVWHEYCDWYLELSKAVLYDEQALGSMKRGTRRTLIYVLNQILKLLHPIMPFITEEIWQLTIKSSNDNCETIMLSNYPSIETEFINASIEEEIEWLKKIIQSIRTIRSEMSISPAKFIPLILRNASHEITLRVEKYTHTLKLLSKITDVQYLANNIEPPLSASAVVGELELLIPMAGIINKDAELARLEKEILKLSKEISMAENKLNNPAFSEKAPQEIIEKEREKLLQSRLAKNKLSQSRAAINAI
jgi:valyl-tRNA synthetase